MGAKSDDASRFMSRVCSVETPHKCWVFDCTERSGSGAAYGLGRFCRKHLNHWRRHGHPTQRSYTAGEVRPYRDGAARWLAANADDPGVINALAALRQLYAASGRAVEPRHLRGSSAKEKAAAIWARLRDRQVAPDAILSVALGATLCVANDPQRPSTAEWRYVQIAKLLTRMGGGVVRRWSSRHCR